jgi:Methionyl-tRNA formyltransferase
MENKLQIGYFADGPWSHRALQKILKDHSIEIKFIVPRLDTKDNTLKEMAKANGVAYLEGVKLNSEEFYNQAKEIGCDLFVSMSYNQIFKPRITNLPRLGTINCHAGKLPFYRGRNILNWVLINDEKEFGITVHYIDEGIDSGDIILQRTYPISDQDTYKTLLDIAYVGCAEILYDAIKMLQNNEVKPVKQTDIHPVGFYCGMRKEGDEIINWNQTSRDLFNFIRAVCKPGPGARTHLDGKEIIVNKAALVPYAPVYKSIVGQVVGKTSRGYVIKTIDSTIEISELETSVKLKIGDRLG